MMDEREQKRRWTRSLIRAIVAEILVIVLIWLLWFWLADQPWSGLGPYTSPVVQQGQTYRPPKTLWDLFDLFVVPAVLAGGAILFNQSARRNETRIAEERRKEEAKIGEDRLQEATLQAYLDRMAELLLDRGLGTDAPKQLRDVAYARTQTALRRLNPGRKEIAVRFLIDSRLVQGGDIQENGAAAPPVVSLRGASLEDTNLAVANLRGADLGAVNLRGANLMLAILSNADLFKANLAEAYLGNAILTGASVFGADLTNTKLLGANLIDAVLSQADLTGADLTGAHLTGTKLVGAKVEKSQLEAAKSLRGATLPDGTVHP